MDLGLKGKIALVTGSTAGIGLATAQGLANEGASVVVNGRTQERVDQAVAKIKEVSPGADVTGIAADLSTAEGVSALVEKLPRVDVLVNNMGIFEPKAFEEITDDDWLNIFQANVMSGVRLTRHYLPGLRERNWGRVLFVSSESAVQIPAEMIHYGVTKTAQVAVARGIAETLVGTGVTVNSVLVGPTNSEGVGTFVSQMAKKEGVDEATMEKQFFETARPSSLIKRFETTEEVANMIVYLSSEQASATTGSAIRVDGGVTRAIL
ncbi:oxidoreductase [Capsulimonas corticalis]|uniref:Oxidoreductase n=1 Tax=Capsulimonas corticalis TaxID=2219043 RepID=A0A402CTT6_9BACT|nr:SDR family NAD(P)-dependent oxidoreductase [Capsulimonas corticalis]BDI30633.1 oxidoreductase [Capsulimonas corticalis]